MVQNEQKFSFHLHDTFKGTSVAAVKEVAN